MTAPATTDTAAHHRERMVADLVEHGWIRTDAVRAAMGALPKEVFLPSTTLKEVYDPDEIVRVKTTNDGRTLSSASAPWLVARMLEDAQIRPGERILEIGTARGINAAYLGILTGPTGQVTTVEIDEDFIGDARAALSASGVTNVRVLHRDGALGAAEYGPYDVITVTAQAVDLQAAWLDQLAPRGRLLVPLRLRGLYRTCVFEADGENLRTTSQLVSGFVAMQGTAALEQQCVELRPGVTLLIDGDQADAPSLHRLVQDGPVQLRTGVTVGRREPCLPPMDLYLAAALDDYGRLHVTREAADEHLPETLGIGHSATWTERGFAAVALRRLDETTTEIEVWGYGPDGQGLAEQVTDHVRTWNADHRGGPDPQLRAYRAGTPDDQLALGRVIERRESRFVLSF